MHIYTMYCMYTLFEHEVVLHKLIRSTIYCFTVFKCVRKVRMVKELIVCTVCMYVCMYVC